MTAAASRAPTSLQPRPKGIATSTTSAQSASAATKPSALQPDPPVSRVSGTRQLLADPLSEKATTFLIRRTLCPATTDKGAPVLDLLTPLTSRNDVDLELYAFIAIIIREFVHTWYAKITPDQVFVEEVVQIIAHCTRALEQRLRKVDLEALIFDELPELLDTHIKTYRAAHSQWHPPPLVTEHHVIYHNLWPHPAMSPIPNEREPSSGLIQKENEAAYRQLLVQGVLAILLPTEDLENTCLTALVGQILAEMILGNGLGGRACEPWLIWEVIAKMADVCQARMPKSKAQERVDKSNMEEVNTNKAEGARGGKTTWSVQNLFWLILQYTFLILTTIRFVIVTIAGSSSLPTRIPAHTHPSGSAPVGHDPKTPRLNKDTGTTSSSLALPLTRPILSMNIWSCASDLLDLNTRMPWLSATLSMLQWCAQRGPGHIGETDGMVDRLLSHTIRTRFLNPTLIPTLLRSARAALFPGNIPAAPRIAPPLDEQLLIRRRCAESILALVPTKVQDVYFGPRNERRMVEMEEVLDLFGDSYCNKHMIYAIVDLLVVRLMPEMAEKGVEQLLDERLS